MLSTVSMVSRMRMLPSRSERPSVISRILAAAKNRGGGGAAAKTGGAGGKTVIVRWDRDDYEEREIKTDSDFTAFPKKALYPSHQPAGITQDGQPVVKAVTCVHELQSGKVYHTAQEPSLKRLQGWQESVVASGEAAAQAAGWAYTQARVAKWHGSGAKISPLQSTGQLRNARGTRTIGQIDAGVVVDLPGEGQQALLISKKTRLMPDNVGELGHTISKIINYRDRDTFASLKEFRGKDLHGALMAEVLPQDPEDLQDVFEEIKAHNFVLFVRNGADFSPHADDYSMFLHQADSW